MITHRKAKTIWCLACALLLAWLAAGCEGHYRGKPPRAEDAAALKKLLTDVSKINALLADYQGKIGKPKDDYVPTEDQRQKLLSMWAPYMDHMRALQSFELKFLSGWRKEPTTVLQTEALAAGVTALAAQVSTNLKFLRAFGKLPQFRKILNDPSAEYGVTGGEFDRLVVRMAKPQTFFLLQVGVQALNRRVGNIRGDKDKDHAAFSDLASQAVEFANKAEADYSRAAIAVMMQGVTTVAGNQVDELSGALITDIAEWLGDARLRSRADSLISQAQVDWLATQCQPGDILVERRNWYLSNIGLPGFWPHAEFYIGTPDDLAKYLDGDTDVQKLYGTGGLTGYLKDKLPDAWAKYAAKAADGYPHRILEAVSEGVQFSSLTEAAKGDYVGAMRPRLSKVDRARAIAKGFVQLGKPYDFDFDFLTESTLVCSELVYVSYRPEKGGETGLNLPLEDVMGRQTLPPTNLVQLFDTQHDTPQQQLDFVAFLDGRESSGTAVVATEADLRASWRRPKWDVAQQ